MSNKWETAPSSFKDLYLNLRELFDLYCLDYELLEKVLDDYNKLEAKHKKALEAISRCKDEIDDKDKLIEELTHENHAYRLTNLINRTYGLTGQIELLNKEIDELKKENKDLKDMLGKENEDLNDTVLRECWGLHKKIDSLWSVNEELNRKIKALEKENKGLKQTIARITNY